MKTVYLLESYVCYEGGDVLGVFATEEDARKAFWDNIDTGEIFGMFGDGVFITRREVGKMLSKDYDLIADFERSFSGEWEEVTEDA